MSWHKLTFSKPCRHLQGFFFGIKKALRNARKALGLKLYFGECQFNFVDFRDDYFGRASQAF